MRQFGERFEQAYLQQSAPRPLPLATAAGLLADYIFERPLSAVLNPVVVLAAGAAVALALVGASLPLLALPLMVLALQIALNVRRIWRRAWTEMILLQHGRAVRAHVLRLRPHHTAGGAIEGALIDCAIPVAERRTYVGRLWVADSDEAQRLARQGRVTVLCLPRAPGTWRVLDPVRSEVRYDRKGRSPALPQEV